MAIVGTRQLNTKAGMATVVLSNADTEGEAVDDINEYCSDHGMTRADEQSPAFMNDKEFGRVFYSTCQ